MHSGLAEQSDNLESIITQQIVGKYTRVFPDYNGHETCSYIIDGKWYIISVLKDDFTDITSEQKETYRSFIRTCVNAAWKILIIAQKGNKFHSVFINSILPVKIYNTLVRYIDRPYLSQQISKCIVDFFYKDDDKGYTLKNSLAIRCIETQCPECNQVLFVPVKVFIRGKGNKEIGYMPANNWSEQILSNLRLHIPHLLGPVVTPIVFDDLPSTHFKFICPKCAETIPGYRHPDSNKMMDLLLSMHLDYDSLCLITPL